MEHYEKRGERFAALEDKYAEYDVLDLDNQKLGRVDELLLNENDQPEYIGVRVGAASAGSTLIPMEIATIDEERKYILLPVERMRAERGPTFGDDQEITPEDEAEVRSHYGLGTAKTSGGGGSYGGYSDEHVTSRHADEERRDRGREASGEVGPGIHMGDTESGEFRRHSADREGGRQPGSDLEDEDELRVQRSEEELRAGTREREAGSMRVRKRVRTERERKYVPTRREQVSVERVPVNEEVAEAQIGDKEVSMPVVEDEIVVDKRAVVKEEIRVRKDVVDEEKVVEGNVRKEEVEVEDDTERGQGLR